MPRHMGEHQTVQPKEQVPEFRQTFPILFSTYPACQFRCRQLNWIGDIQDLFAIHSLPNGLYGHLSLPSHQSEPGSEAKKNQVHPMHKKEEGSQLGGTVVALASLLTAVVLNTRANWRAFFAGGGRMMRDSLGDCLMDAVEESGLRRVNRRGD